jgi:hypothetical protein
MLITLTQAGPCIFPPNPPRRLPHPAPSGNIGSFYADWTRHDLTAPGGTEGRVPETIVAVKLPWLRNGESLSILQHTGFAIISLLFTAIGLYLVRFASL